MNTDTQHSRGHLGFVDFLAVFGEPTWSLGSPGLVLGAMNILRCIGSRALVLAGSLALLGACTKVPEPRQPAATPDSTPQAPASNTQEPAAPTLSEASPTLEQEAPAEPAPEPPAKAQRQQTGPPRIGITGKLNSQRLHANVEKRIRAAGGIPVRLHPRAESSLDRVEGLVLVGGADIDPEIYGEKKHPTTKLLDKNRENFELALVKEAVERKLPVLGICLGAQIIWVAQEGSLIQDIPSEVGTSVNHRAKDAGHIVRLEESSRLRAIYDRGQLSVFSNHHQTMDGEAQAPLGLVVSGHSRDGLVESFEASDPSHFLIGIGWHAERKASEQALFDALILEIIE